MSKTVLITGGSSGIGFTLSKYFLKDGYRLLWVSLLAEELESSKQKLTSEFASAEIHTLSKDLSHANAAQEVINWVNEHNWQIDVLVNNAGFGTFGYIQNINMERELSMIQLNVVNLYKMTRLFMESMLEKNQGTIINISSNSSFQPTPKLTTYASTKAFVSHFSQGLQWELEQQKSAVRVMTVCPAAISDTPFKKSGNMENVKTFKGLASTTSEEVARDIWRGYQNGKTFVVTGRRMRFLYAIRGLVPKAITQFIIRKETEEN
jgi:short-subunit dehydrogenase